MPITVKTFASIGEAASALASDRSARFLAGGTLVMRAINEGDASLATIVRATDRSFGEIRPAGARITIGAGATMAQVLAHRELAFLHPAARAVGGPAIRNAATVGGNLFAPAPYGDFTVALLALDATLAMHGSYSGRELPLEEFLAGRDRHGGLVAGVTFSRPAGPEAFRFAKVARVMPPSSRLLPSSARVAYGAMAPTPIRARSVERALEGRSLDEGGIAAALAAAAEGTSPATDAIASAWYRREMIAVHLKRLLLGEGR